MEELSMEIVVGGGGVIAEGDIQWMTAGKGVLHKEFHETEWSKQGGLFQMIQLWVNLPAKYKTVEPNYQALANKDLQKFELLDDSGFVEVIAGQYNGTAGIAETFSPIEMYNLKAKSGATATFTIPASFNTFVLVLDGEIEINGSEVVKENHLALMKNDGEDFTIKVQQDAVVFIAGGEPINEPIVHYGPFVMNTEEEIRLAIQDFQNGKFGNLN